MSPAVVRRLARGLAALAVVAEVGGYAVATDANGFSLVDLAWVAVAPVFAIVGVLVASRHPRNAIGWILVGVALCSGLASACGAVVEQRVQAGGDPGALAGAVAVGVEYSFIGVAMLPATFLLLLFPNGHLPSPRWRKIAWCGAVGMLGLLVTGSITEPLSDYPTVRNPFAVEGDLFPALMVASIVAMYVGVFGAVASVVVRFRRGGPVERQQIKWLATAGAILAVVLPIDGALQSVTGDAAFIASQLALLGLPAAVGIAILRYRLYDIDVVINRTLVYGALTATLAGAYLGSVLVLQLALQPLTASSNLAIAGSTLAVAALFQPARRRIQAIVDRRFYRRKYDAARTIERFGTTLRGGVELDVLSEELRAVVAETMAPAHVSLWLRPPRERA